MKHLKHVNRRRDRGQGGNIVELQTEKPEKTRGLITKILVWTGIVLFVAATIAANVYQKKTGTAFAPKDLKTTIVQKMTMSRTLLASGKVEPAHISRVYLDPSKGQISEVYVSQGDRVQKGDKLFRYDDAQIQSQLDSLQTKKQTTNAQINHQNSQIANLESQISDLDQKITDARNKGEPDSAISQLKQQQSQLQSQESDLKYQNKLSRIDLQQNESQIRQTQNQLNGLIVKSAINGVVENVADKPYSAQSPIVTVASGQPYVVHGTLSEYDVVHVKKGQRVSIQAEALGGKQWSGKVAEIGNMPVESQQPAAASQQLQSVSSYPFTATIDKKSKDLRPGYHVNVEITVAQHKNVPAVPYNAILAENNHSYVFVVKNGKLHRRKIETGLTNGKEKEVTKGLKPGEKIVLDPTDKLKEGMVIRHDPAK